MYYAFRGHCQYILTHGEEWGRWGGKDFTISLVENGGQFDICFKAQTHDRNSYFEQTKIFDVISNQNGMVSLLIIHRRYLCMLLDLVRPVRACTDWYIYAT